MKLARILPRSRGAFFSVLAADLAFLALAGCDQPNLVPPAPQVAYGTKIDFGQNGNSAPLKANGWQPTEDQFTWTDGTEVVLNMQIPPTAGAVILKMTLAGMIKEPELAAQPVEVYVNESKIADWQVGNTAPFTAPFPQEVTKKGGPLKLTLKIPKATSPKQLGVSQDGRLLGVRVFDLELSSP